MARGGIRRSRCDENARRAEEEEAEAVKRAKGADYGSSREKEGTGSSKEQQQSRKGKKSGRRRGRAKKDGSSMATALLPINENASGSSLEGGIAKKDEDLLVDKAKNVEVEAVAWEIFAVVESTKPASLSEDGEVELSSSSCMHSPESPKEKTVIWSNAAFCSEQQTQTPTATMSVEKSVLACNDDTVAGMELMTAEDTKGSDDSLAVKLSLAVDEKEANEVHEVKVPEKNEMTAIVEDEEVDHLEKEIENEIALLTKRLAELRAKREAKHKTQERAKRALSCPPTPLSSGLQEQTNDGDKSKSRGKGRMVSAKFLQWPTKSPDLEPKTSEKRASFRRNEATTISFQATPTNAVTPFSKGTSTGAVTSFSKATTPHHGRAPVPDAEQKETSLKSAPRVSVPDAEQKEASLKSAPRVPVPDAEQKETSLKSAPRVLLRSKAIEKLQAGAGLKCLARPASSLKGSYRCSLDGNFIEQIRNLSLSPATSNVSEASKKFDWTKSLRSGATVEKRPQVDESHKKAKGTPEAQLLVDLKESNKASKVSPSVTRKVRNVASRYNESPAQHQPTRKRSLDIPSQAPEMGGAAPAASSHRKRVSLDQQQQQEQAVVDAANPPARKSGIGAAARSGLSRLRPRNPASKEAMKTPPMRRDGLESELKKLPGLVINREVEYSPRDSGCVKRASQQGGQKSFFLSTESWDAGHRDE
ncbi:hypothetical protein SELMODRAFT_442564, partial [Selaginella moellendorffii]